MTEELKELKVLCPFCSAPQGVKFEVEAIHNAGCCDTCDYGASTDIEIDVYCEECKRLIYRKEYTQ